MAAQLPEKLVEMVYTRRVSRGEPQVEETNVFGSFEAFNFSTNTTRRDAMGELNRRGFRFVHEFVDPLTERFHQIWSKD
jgi:hypothetical protein